MCNFAAIELCPHRVCVAGSCNCQCMIFPFQQFASHDSRTKNAANREKSYTRRKSGMPSKLLATSPAPSCSKPPTHTRSILLRVSCVTLIAPVITALGYRAPRAGSVPSKLLFQFQDNSTSPFPIRWRYGRWLGRGGRGKEAGKGN